MKTSLIFKEGSSHKEYHAAIEPCGEGYVVDFAYGRVGSALTTGTKTQKPVSLAEAEKIHEKLIKSKTSKGYKPAEGQTLAIRHVKDSGEDTGIRPQLLNAISEKEAFNLIDEWDYKMQEKFDGRRMLLQKEDGQITGINRRGLKVSVPQAIHDEAARIRVNFLIDGEIIGDVYHAFDCLEIDNECIRDRAFITRNENCSLLLGSTQESSIRLTETATGPLQKNRLFKAIKERNGEGVVFKDALAPYTEGRPNSGGTQLKFKFVETASFVVISLNDQRSVSLGVWDGKDLLPAGNVTILPNFEIPQPYDVVEVRYLYAFKESNAVFQPVYLGKRDDIKQTDCKIEQLKYKPKPCPTPSSPQN